MSDGMDPSLSQLPNVFNMEFRRTSSHYTLHYLDSSVIFNQCIWPNNRLIHQLDFPIGGIGKSALNSNQLSNGAIEARFPKP